MSKIRAPLLLNRTIKRVILSRASGKQLVKREVKLQDRSGAAVSLTLWGKDAENFDTGLTNPVVAVKAAKVSDFGGRSLSVSFNSTMQVLVVWLLGLGWDRLKGKRN